MDDKGSFFMLGFLVGALLMGLLFLSLQGDLVTQRAVIDSGCGHYDAKTGEFVMGK